MEIDYDTKAVSTAGTAEQLSTSTRKARAISFHARSDNTGSVYVGKSDVSSAKGREIEPGEAWEPSFGETASVDMDIWYVDSDNNGDQLDWQALLL